MPAEVGSPDQKVLLVAEQIASRVERYDAAHDHRAAFGYTYFRLTKSLESGLAGGVPAFDDPRWVADLAVSLASDYFAAMDGIDVWLETRPKPGAPVRPEDLPDSIPQPWRDAYAASSIPRTYVLEDVLFAMMAHISYDLPMALQRMAAIAPIARHIADFHRMNDILASCIDQIQSELAARYWRALADLDRLFTMQDELLTNYGVRLARGMAWFNFDRISDPKASASALLSIQRSTAGLIQDIRAPQDWKLRMGLRIGRHLIPSRRQWPAAGSLS